MPATWCSTFEAAIDRFIYPDLVIQTLGHRRAAHRREVLPHVGKRSQGDPPRPRTERHPGHSQAGEFGLRQGPGYADDAHPALPDALDEAADRLDV